MYTIALVIMLGLIAGVVLELLVEKLPFINKIPVIGDNAVLYIVVSVLIVWLTDTSVLGAFGIGATDKWIDVVGSGFAIAVVNTTVVHSLVNYLDKK